MADNVHRKLHKLSDGGRKISNPVQRTTTETIRLGEVDKLHQPVSLIAPSNVTAGGGGQCNRKKTSSFQITSVTVGCRMSNDAGEDSNDDLDESHTEDNSVEHSRITDLDIETPSYSEDTFSKEDVFFNTSNAALSTAPVIPTSSQYGLAIVPSEHGGNVSNSVNDSNIGTLDITSVTDNNIINLLSGNVKQDADLREVHSHGRNERFKVVKIESTEPFKRGRWTCMDYLDHTSVNQPTAIGTPKVSDPNEVCISYGVTDSGVVVPEAASKQPVVVSDDSKTISIDSNGQVTASHPDTVHTSISVASNAASVANASYAVSNSMPPNVQHNPAQVPPGQQAKVQPAAQIPQYFQSQTQPIAAQQQPPPSQPQPPQGAQGSTLPASLQPSHPNSMGQPQSMPQGAIPIIAQTSGSNVTPQQQGIAHTKEEAYVTVAAAQSQSMPVQNVCQATVQSSGQPPSSQAPNILVTQHQTDAACQQQQQPPPSLQTQTQISQISEPLTAIPGIQGMQNIHKVPPPQAAPQQTSSTIHAAGTGPQVQSQQVMPASTQMQTSSSTASVQITQVQAAAGCQNVVAGGGLQQPGIAFHQSDPEQDSISAIVANAAQSADATLLESLAEVTQGSDEHRALEDNERYRLRIHSFKLFRNVSRQ